MSRMLVYFFLIVSPSINFKLVLWISFSRNLQEKNIINIKTNNHTIKRSRAQEEISFGNPPEPLPLTTLLKQLLAALHLVAGRHHLQQLDHVLLCQEVAPFRIASSKLRCGRSSVQFRISTCSTSSSDPPPRQEYHPHPCYLSTTLKSMVCIAESEDMFLRGSGSR